MAQLLRGLMTTNPLNLPFDQMLISQYPGLVFFYFSPLKGWRSIYSLDFLFSHNECLFFCQVFPGTPIFPFAWIKVLHIRRCEIISLNALDVLYHRSKASSSKPPLPPPPPVCSLTLCALTPSHRLKHPCSSSGGSPPITATASLSFPVPLSPETLQRASCPPWLRAFACLALPELPRL